MARRLSCYACGEPLESSEMPDGTIEVKPCETCLRVAESDAYERGREEAEEDDN